MASPTEEHVDRATDMWKAAAVADHNGFKVRVKVRDYATYIDLIDPETGASYPVWSWVHEKRED